MPGECCRSVAIRTSLVLLLFGSVGCATVRWEETSQILDTLDCVVEIERGIVDPGEPPIEYGHPATVPVGDLLAALGSIHFEKLRLLNQDQTPLAIAEVHHPAVAAALARGLSVCRPDERVRFWIENPDDALWVFSTASLTRGVAFVDTAGRLNLVFDLIGYVPAEDEPGAHLAWGDPTARAISRAEILPGPYQRPEGATHDLWIAFDDPAAAGPSEAGSVEAASAEEAAGEGDASVADAAPEKTPPTTLPTTDEPLTDAEILAQLRYLEQLWAGGHITEEVYRKERARLLERR